jgi:catechol 2,3-dioxygenase-like lactoylglutathione lyase family enzyme
MAVRRLNHAVLHVSDAARSAAFYAAALGMERPHGAMVNDVMKDGAASKAV